MSENESSSSQSLADTFRTEAFALGLSGETIARMNLSSERALACVREAVSRGAGPGLAIHMFDAGDWPSKPKPQGVNLNSPVSECSTCGGDRFVLVALRDPVQSTWMREKGLQPNKTEKFEEYAACPDCNPVDTSFHRGGGGYAKALDPARVREMMNG